MELSRKLSRLSPPVPARAPRAPTSFPLTGEGPPATSAAPAGASSATALFPGVLLETSPIGPKHVAEGSFDAQARHGDTLLAPARSVAGAHLALLALDQTLCEVDCERLLFLDTETTGLSGGAGTLPFLIGLAWFEGGEFRVRQLFLSRPGLEAPMLHEVAERMSRASALVTFNGKSFDWPLLRTRFVLNRMVAPVPSLHVDLLHCTRRVFGRRAQGARLTELERHVLGLERHDDLPGEAIPEAYFSFLSTGSAQLMPKVVEHNRNDLLAMAALVTALGDCLAPERTATVDPTDSLGLARVALRGGQRPLALRFAQRAAESPEPEIGAEGQLLLAQLRARAGEPLEAARALLRALELLGGCPRKSPPVHLSLAKLYEHRLGDLERALHHARASRGIEGHAPWTKRLTRLQGRLDQRAADAPERLGY